MRYTDFYIELGKLIYAVAKSDGNIQDVEIEKFHNIVKDKLLPLEDSLDDFGSDNAFYTEFEFEKLVERNASIKESYSSFVTFLEEHKSAITDDVKKVCLDVVEEMASIGSAMLLLLKWDDDRKRLVDQLHGYGISLKIVLITDEESPDQPENALIFKPRDVFMGNIRDL